MEMALLGKTAACVAIFGGLCAATAVEARPGWYRPGWQQPEYRFVMHTAPYGVRVRAIGLRRDDGPTGVRVCADRHVERHFAEKRHPKPLRLVTGAAMREDVAALAAMRADEIAHVLDDADNRHFGLLEHCH